jgi:iron(III) transport system permease protein
MTAQILNETDAARYGEAFAYSTLLIVIVLMAIGLLTLVVGSRTGAEQRADIGGTAFG